MVDYKINDIYQGGYNSLSPPESDVFSGYRAPAGEFGTTTDPRVGNILGEASSKLNAGLKQIELSLITPQIFDAVPKQQLKEINRLSKLTGVDMSVHGPLIESSGISQQGFDEMARKGTEKQITFAIERAHEVDPDGNIPVTFHSTVQAPSSLYMKDQDGNINKERMPIINQETGQLAMIKPEERFYPAIGKDGELKEQTLGINKMLNMRNEAEWDNSLTQLIAVKDRADRMIDENLPFVQKVHEEAQKRGINPAELVQGSPLHRENLQRFGNAQAELRDIHMHLSGLFNKAYKYGSDSDKAYLKVVAEEFEKTVNGRDDGNGKVFSYAMQNFMERLRPNENFNAPEVYMSAEKFAIEKSGETFGNAAFNIYKKAQKEGWKGNPIISIENPPAGTTGLNRGEDLKDLVEASQKQFVDKATKEGMSKKEAKAQAEKLIGVTWDVGHINMLRKYGFEDEDIIKETEKIKPHLKHVHLSDNFGYEHTELPMGMGNVPLKQIMEKLGKKGFEAKKVIEAADWWQHFKTPPFQETLEAFGSPVYSMKMAPYWSQSLGYQQGYFSGYGEMLPQVNYETFGAGFSQLPMDLGGQRAGGRGGRMSGRPME